MQDNRDDEIIGLLKEMRDLQREHLDEYRQFAERALQSQQAMAGFYKRVVAVAALVVAGLLIWLYCFLPIE